MQLRGTMILVLVVWLLLGWVRSQDGSADFTSRHRRDHQRRRTLEKLAARGLTGAERERVAEEILARLYLYSSTTTTTTTTTTTPPQLRPHRHRHHHQLRSYDHLSPRLARLASEMVDERPPESASLRYSQEIFEDALGETDLVVEEEDDVSDSSGPPLINQYMETETMELLNRGKREREQTREGRNSRKNRRNERRQECQKRRKRCKELRQTLKRRKKTDRDVRRLINVTIPVYEDENKTKYIDCCPSELRSVSKISGKSRSHTTMEIHPDHRAFTEHLCLERFLNKECIIPARALKPEVSTRCVQQYSYSQALIRPWNSTEEKWKQGSIQVGSGCSCQVSIKHKKKKRKRKKR